MSHLLIPFKSWFKNRVAEAKCTPDYPELNNWETFYVFTYGSLKSGQIRDMGRLLEDAEFIGDFRTLVPTFSLGYSELGGYPFVKRGLPYQDGSCYIKGEIWEITNEDLSIVDIIEGNGTLYKRQPESFVSLATGEVLKAYMYLSVPGRIEFADNMTSTKCVEELDGPIKGGKKMLNWKGVT